MGSSGRACKIRTRVSCISNEPTMHVCENDLKRIHWTLCYERLAGRNTASTKSKTLSKSRLKQPRCKRLKRCNKKFFQWYTFLEVTRKVQTGDRNWFQHLLSNQDLSLMHKTQAESANYRKTKTKNYNGLNKATREVTHAS